MCFPGAGAVAQVGISAASGIAQYDAAQQQYQGKVTQYEENAENALAANRADETALTTRQLQENQNFSQQTQLTLLEGAKEKAQAVAAAAHGGVAGVDLTSVINGIGEQVNQKNTALSINYHDTVQQIQTQKDTSVFEAGMRANSENPGSAPSAAGEVLGVAGDAAKAAGSTSGQAGISAVQSSLSGLSFTGM